jgi:hypothetical protein
MSGLMVAIPLADSSKASSEFRSGLIALSLSAFAPNHTYRSLQVSEWIFVQIPSQAECVAA